MDPTYEAPTLGLVPDFSTWTSYPNIYALGHRNLKELFLAPVIVEEKVDGSQFSFGVFVSENHEGGLEWRCRSKGAQLNLIAPEKMFARAVEVVKGLPLKVGWTYRAEYLNRPKHNALAYDRTPEKNLIIFDVCRAPGEWLSYEEKAAEAKRLGLEVVPLVYEGMVSDVTMFRALIDRVSILGGQKVEGVVVKSYVAPLGELRRNVPLIGKFVSEAFKEVHTGRPAGPGRKDVIESLVAQYGTATRWAKAVQHLKEAGKLTSSPKDIGPLIAETWGDIEKEHKEDIKDFLYDWAAKQLRSGVANGLPMWYKELLLKEQFEQEGTVELLRPAGSVRYDNVLDLE